MVAVGLCHVCRLVTLVSGHEGSTGWLEGQCSTLVPIEHVRGDKEVNGVGRRVVQQWFVVEEATQSTGQRCWWAHDVYSEGPQTPVKGCTKSTLVWPKV